MLITDNQGVAVEQRHFDAWGNIVKLTDGNGNAITDFVILNRGYTGHEHLTKVGLIHMNGRLYDPLLHRFLSPDNFVQDPYNTQNYNRYGYVLNNPLSHVDPSGEFLHLIIGAAIGGLSNWIANGAHFSWKGLAQFGVGAIAGALSAGIGAGISSALAGGSFGAGFLGTSAALTASSSFIAGAAVGGGAGFGGGFITGFGNGLLDQKSFGDALSSGFKTGLIGGLSGGLVGGLIGGIDAAIDGRRFFDGATYNDEKFLDPTIKIVNQKGDNNCLPASGESIDNSLGGNLSQENLRDLFGGDPNLVPLKDQKFWRAYSVNSCNRFQPDIAVGSGGEGLRINTVLRSGGKVAVNLNLGNTTGHSVVVNSSTVRTIIKTNGDIIKKYFFSAMNPANGGSFVRYTESEMRKAFNIFYFFK